MALSAWHWTKSAVAVVLVVWSATAQAQQITDTFTRPDDTLVGATETPVPGIAYNERNNAGAIADSAAISGGELLIYGDQNNAPVASAPGQVIIPVQAAQVTLSARMRFSLSGSGTTTSTMGGFMLRKPNLNAEIQNVSGAYQILVEMLPTGAFLIRQKNATGTGLTNLYANNPFAPGTTLNAFQAAGTLPTSINGQPFDANGNGRLEGDEPFTLTATLIGTTMTVSINDQATVTSALFTNQVQNTANAPNNYVSLFKNRYSGAPPVGANIYFDNLQVTVHDLNDTCATAKAIGDGVTLGETLIAAASGTASCGNSDSSPDLWYSYTATCTGDLVLSTCGSALDTVLSVYSGSCASPVEIACNDDCAGSPCSGSASCARIPVTTGEQLLIRVAGNNGARGTFRLEARCGVPQNDFCAQATPIGEGVTEGTTSNASNDGTAGCGSSNTSPDVWYSYTSPHDAVLDVSTCGSALDTVVSVYDGCGGTELACSDNCGGTPCGAPGSCLSLTVQAGATYLIRVSGNSGLEGNFQLLLKDSVLVQHFGSAHPVTTEGWAESGAGTFSRSAGSEGLAYWRQQANAGARLSYIADSASTTKVVAADFQNPAGWTLTATLRALIAPDAYQALVYAADGQSHWGLHAVARDAIGERGVYRTPVVPASISTADLVADLDPSDGYHTYQIVYDPAADGGNGGVSFYVDGVLIGTEVRANVPATGLAKVQWGDDSGFTGYIFGGPVASDVHYAFVRFETGQHVYAGPPVTNDTCATATVVGRGEFYGASGQATAAGSASCGNSNGSPDLWYAYTADCTGNLVVDTCGTMLDTVISVYNACGGTQLGCDDNSCGLQSRALAAVTQGNTYLIRVAGNSGAAGPFRFHVACGTPANDSCANATVVPGGATLGTTLGATSDGAASCGSSAGSPDVWYRYTSTCNAPLEVNTCGSGFDTVVSIHSGCGSADLACGDNECGLQSRAEVMGVQGQTYWIRVSGKNGAAGDFTMNVLCKVPPVNDQCGNAITITDGTTSGSNLFGSFDGDATCGSTYGGPDVWYTYAATRSGRLKLDASAADFPAVLSVHTGCPGNLDNQLACGTSITSLTVAQGGVYRIRVAGVSGASGNFDLELSYDTVIIKHEGQNVPTTEGWTRDVTSAGTAVEAGGNDGQPYWGMSQVDGARLNYQFTGLAPSDFADPQGWTMTAIAKTTAAPSEWQAHLLLQDGQDTWTIHLIDGSGFIPRGVYVTGQTLSTLIRISDIDPGAAYHQYQIAYNPNTQTATYIIDGTAVYTQTREDAFDASLRRLVWGDNASGGGPSGSRWNLVQFEFGSQAAGCFAPVFDTDGDKDVDMDDFGAFQACFTGATPGIAEGCSCFDWNGDEMIDVADYAKFLNCASGADVPAPADCDD